MRLVYSLIACCLLVGCDPVDRSLLKSPITLGVTAVVIVPSRSLTTPFGWNLLCVAAPSDYTVLHSSLHGPRGEDVVLEATLTTTDGRKILFTHEGRMQGGYAVLQADPSIRPGLRYKELAIMSSAPLSTREIRWISTEKM